MGLITNRILLGSGVDFPAILRRCQDRLVGIAVNRLCLTVLPNLLFAFEITVLAESAASLHDVSPFLETGFWMLDKAATG
jgi:hypothetical protein